MQQETEKALANYISLYTKLHNRTPQDARVVDTEWVIVNGARMRITELEFLVQQLQREYEQLRQERRTIVSRLVKWFTG